MSSLHPGNDIETVESMHAFYCFCTFCYLYYGKKVNFATIFTKVITDKKIRNFYKQLISEDNDYEALKIFIDFEPSVTKSKYVTKIINRKKIILDD